MHMFPVFNLSSPTCSIYTLHKHDIRINSPSLIKSPMKNVIYKNKTIFITALFHSL